MNAFIQHVLARGSKSDSAKGGVLGVVNGFTKTGKPKVQRLAASAIVTPPAIGAPVEQVRKFLNAEDTRLSTIRSTVEVAGEATRQEVTAVGADDVVSFLVSQGMAKETPIAKGKGSKKGDETPSTEDNRQTAIDNAAKGITV